MSPPVYVAAEVSALKNVPVFINLVLAAAGAENTYVHLKLK